MRAASSCRPPGASAETPPCEAKPSSGVRVRRTSPQPSGAAVRPGDRRGPSPPKRLAAAASVRLRPFRVSGGRSLVPPRTPQRQRSRSGEAAPLPPRGKRSKSGVCARRLRENFPLRSNGFADVPMTANPPIHDWRVYWAMGFASELCPWWSAGEADSLTPPKKCGYRSCRTRSLRDVPTVRAPGHTSEERILSFCQPVPSSRK